MNGFEGPDPSDCDMDAVIDAARLGVEPRTLNPDTPQAFVVPAGAELVLPDVSAWRDAPARKTGVYRPATVDALVDYLTWQGLPDSTIWVNPTSGKVEAILDDNGDQTPGYRQHRALLQLIVTPEWTYWAEQDGKMMGQQDFALHIEQGLMEILEPPAADLLEIAQSFHASNNATFRSATRLASGETQFLYDEEIQASAGASGRLQIPERFELLICPFVGEEARVLHARFRYRINSGKLQLGFKLEQPERAVRECLDAIASRLRSEFTHVFVGEAPA